jgi:hypothetical protein
VTREQGAAFERPARWADAPWLDRLVVVLWATVKFVIGSLATPFVSPLVAWRASVNHERAKGMMRVVPHQIAALDSGRVPVEPSNRVDWLRADTDVLIVSDLHRSIAGDRDWARSQGAVEIYEAMLDHYGNAGWHVVENGDTEDHWMVGGSAYGSVYDAFRLVASIVPGRLGRIARRRLYREHSRRIRENYPGVYQRLAALGREGRHHRTVGNHDDVYLDHRLADDLRDALGVAPVDWVVLQHEGRAAAVITHGHLTDAWNAPHRAFLGELAMWAANTLDDIPLLDSPEPLPDRADTEHLLSGRHLNRLLTVNQRFGVNANYDSLDEEMLFDAVGGASETVPWLFLGHTHAPLMQPISRTGARWARYANSGHGLYREAITAIEWAGSSGPPFTPRLVAWVNRETTEGRRIERVQLEPSADGSVLRPVFAGSAAGVTESAVAAR